MTVVDRPSTPATSTRRRPPTPQIVIGGVLVLIGVLWLLERLGAVDLTVTAVLGLATLVIGIALMLLSGRGAHGGLIVFGSFIAMLALVTAIAPFEGFQGGVGDRIIEVSSVDDIRPDYNLALGKLTIDLRMADDLSAGADLNASVGMGELVVRVPAGTEISVESRVGAGEIDVLGRDLGGVGVDDIYETPGFADGDQRITLDLQVFAGRVEVTDE
ncbi:MAG TPA: LiaF domain-containing protein [Acidimicrobiia bacterium]|nr:LiaF domain-containing protein [Acidimicrobiia bacterium]